MDNKISSLFVVSSDQFTSQRLAHNSVFSLDTISYMNDMLPYHIIKYIYIKGRSRSLSDVKVPLKIVFFILKISMERRYYQGVHRGEGIAITP